jgi:hypothetical protein
MAKAAGMKLAERLAKTEEPKNVVTMDSGIIRGTGHVAAARVGKKATVGHFSEAMSRKLNSMAAAEGHTLQYCMGEAWDLWLQSRGEQPFGER